MVTLTPVNSDPFAEGVGPNITIRPAGGQAAPSSVKLVPVDHDPFADSAPGMVEDAGKGLVSGVGKGFSNLAGLPGDAAHWIDLGLEWLEQTARGEGDDDFAKRVAQRKAKLAELRSQSPVPTLEPPTSKAVRGSIENVTGPFYEPKTRAGKIAGSVGEFIPGALTAGGSARTLFNFAVAPGVGSEIAGELTEGGPYEVPARIGAAVVTGGVSGALNRPATAERALRRSMGNNVTPHVVDQASRLMDDAAARGVRLTWPEALEQVSPGAGLTNMQRVLK